MAREDLSELVSGKSEDLGIEYKAWLDTSDPKVRAQIARHVAALSNNGGGYLVFGVDDTSREPLGETNIDRKRFSQDELAGIARKYLDPRPALRVEEAEHAGVKYPVVVVPSHGPRPIIATADGPQDEQRRPIGIRQGAIYIRATGPESRAIQTADEWNTLLDRCLSHRADYLAKIVRQSIARPSISTSRGTALLAAAAEETRKDFVNQLAALAQRHPNEKDKLLVAQTSHCVLSYVLLDESGEPLTLENLRTLNERVSVAMRNYAYNGWMAFLPLTSHERMPQMKMGNVLGHETTYLEGMRVENTAVLWHHYDYWRMYEMGMSAIVEGYVEDAVRARRGEDPAIYIAHAIFRAHSVLAHARLVGQEVPGVQQVLVRTDYRGLSNRALAWNADSRLLGAPTTSDQFMRTTTLAWADLRDTYFRSLKRIVEPLISFFPIMSGWASYASLTRENVVRALEPFGSATQLFED